MTFIKLNTFQCLLSFLVIYGCNHTEMSISGKSHSASTENGIWNGFGSVDSCDARRISHLSSPESGFDAHGDKVVYTCKGKAYLIDLKNETEEQLTGKFFRSLYVSRPHISYDLIVFNALLRSGSHNLIPAIAVYHILLGNGFIIKGQYGSEMLFSNTDGRYIVWQDHRFFRRNRNASSGSNNIEIYLYDIQKQVTTRVTNMRGLQVTPDVHNDYVVFTDDSDPIQKDVWLYNIAAKETINISKHPSIQWAPSIHGKGVVWQDLRNGEGTNILKYSNSDIYYYDIDTGRTTQITANRSSQMNPRIFDNTILWNDLRNGGRLTNGHPYGGDVYMYDLREGVEKRVTRSEFNDGAGVVTGDKVIWYSQRVRPSALFMKDLEDI